MKAADLMTRDVVALDESSTIGDAVAAAVEHGIRHLPILRGRRPIAMVSDRDLRGLEAASAVDPQTSARSAPYAAPVTSIAAGTPIVVALDASARQAIDAMLEAHVSSVLVVDAQGDLAGIITSVDVLRAAREIL
jgi:CBS domain-containing protein